MAAKSTDWRPGPTVCRCCLSEGCYKDISTEYFWMGKREVYAEMLSETLSVSIAYSQSGGPNSNSRLICEPCISRLRDASDFRRQVLECEKTFMHHLDPGSSTAALDLEVPLVEPLAVDNDVKLERIKLEKQLSDDDDDFDAADFLDDDDDDDLDDQPLTKLASKIPKKESVDLMDLLDNAKAAEKRKSTTKTKISPAKKTKTVKKEVKASVSKAPAKTEKKKKDENRPLSHIARRNAETIVLNATVYPFRLPESALMCVYCSENFSDPSIFRQHMKDEHKTFEVRNAFVHCAYEGYLKVDCTEISCRICEVYFEKITDVAQHLVDEHKFKLNNEVHLGLHPFNFKQDKLMCGICDLNFPCLRQLSRHMGSHFQNFTCDSCGKSYTTNSSLQQHLRFSHNAQERICRKCKKTFSSLEEKKKTYRIIPKMLALSMQYMFRTIYYMVQ